MRVSRSVGSLPILLRAGGEDDGESRDWKKKK